VVWKPRELGGPGPLGAVALNKKVTLKVLLHDKVVGSKGRTELGKTQKRWVLLRAVLKATIYCF